MTELLSKLLFVAFFLAATEAGAQKLRMKTGDLAVLAGQKVLHVEYDYSNFGVGEFSSEKEYIEKKVFEYDLKEPGSGEAWKKKWIGYRTNLFEPRFERRFNKVLEDKGLVLTKEGTDAKYTLIVRATFIEPGFNVAVAGKNASVNLEFDIVETADKSARLAHATLEKVPGFIDGDYNSGSRISEAYATAGRLLGIFVKKKL